MGIKNNRTKLVVNFVNRHLLLLYISIQLPYFKAGNFILSSSIWWLGVRIKTSWLAKICGESKNRQKITRALYIKRRNALFLLLIQTHLLYPSSDTINHITGAPNHSNMRDKGLLLSYIQQCSWGKMIDTFVVSWV